MARKVFYLVTVEIPDEYSANDFNYYMRDAIESWSGGGDPHDALFGWFHTTRKDRKSPRLKIQPVKGDVIRLLHKIRMNFRYGPAVPKRRERKCARCDGRGYFATDMMGSAFEPCPECKTYRQCSDGIHVEKIA